jgi:hypothetical protein
MAMTARPLFLSCALMALTPAVPVPAHAGGGVDSIYTKIEFDTGCIALSTDEVGGTFSCPGHAGYGILFSEGDLRQTVFFGYVGDWYAGNAWESFGAFNQANDTVEWRLRDGVPYATILRWYIENPNPDTGAPDEAHRGQVLVVSKVGQPGIGDACVVGYVDAVANPQANDLARQVADTMADGFACRIDEPAYHGVREPLSGDPTRVFSE